MRAGERASTSVWVVDGEAYDLTEFLAVHPGGPDLLLWCAGRDVSILVHTYHRDPARTVLPRLLKYRLPSTPRGALKPALGIPGFLLPPRFDAASDVPTYAFREPGGSPLLDALRKRVLTPDAQRAIGRLDAVFDVVVGVLLGVYVALAGAWLRGHVPWYVSVPAFVLLRTGLAGGGHYYIHRSKHGPRAPWVGPLADYLFDVNYVGLATTAQDAHVLLHHAYAQSGADPKRGFFGGMQRVPRLLRPIAHTAHKLGHVMNGMLIRAVYLELERDGSNSQGVQGRVRRLAAKGALPGRTPIIWQLWAFALTLWFNTLLVVSSHDFHERVEPEGRDWARFQLLNTHDITITGQPWVDCFLSAGLSPHRAHHLLPYQKSGFANVYSERHVAAAARECGLPWLPPRSLLTDLLPTAARECFLTPAFDPLAEAAGRLATPARSFSSGLLAEHASAAR